MIFPPKWMMKRPGFLFPVFFLSCFAASGQGLWYNTDQVALGQTFVTSTGNSNAGLNQAALGWANQHSVSVQHARPFSLKELALSTLSAQFIVGKGAWGATISTMGIKGFRQNSAWISFGMFLRPGITAGIGIHYWSHQIQEYFFYHPGISFAFGIQVKLNDRLSVGAHVFHPFGWYSNNVGRGTDQMMISAGCSYTFFHSVTYLCDLRISPELKIQTCHGMKLKFGEQLETSLGVHNQPFSLSGGIACYHEAWKLHLSFEFIINTGISPASSITHEW